MARIARGGMELGQCRRRGEPPRERMLATARADDENPHGGRVYGWSARTRHDGAGAYQRHRHIERFGDERDVVGGGSRQRIGTESLAPAGQHLEHRRAVVEVGLMGRKVLGLRLVGQPYSTQTGISSKPESTSSFVSASDVMPSTWTAKRRATRSSQPHRRTRPVTVPNSPPSSRTRSCAGPSICSGRGPRRPGDVRLRHAHDLVDALRPDPEADGSACRDRARRRDGTPTCPAPGSALEEHASALAEGPVDEQGRVRNIGGQPLGVHQRPGNDLLGDQSNGPMPYTRSSQTFFSPAALPDLLAQVSSGRAGPDPYPDPRRLVGICRPDPTPRRPDLEVSEPRSRGLRRARRARA